MGFKRFFRLLGWFSVPVLVTWFITFMYTLYVIAPAEVGYEGEGVTMDMWNYALANPNWTAIGIACAVSIVSFACSLVLATSRD